MRQTAGVAGFTWKGPSLSSSGRAAAPKKNDTDTPTPACPTKTLAAGTPGNQPWRKNSCGEYGWGEAELPIKGRKNLNSSRTSKRIHVLMEMATVSSGGGMNAKRVLSSKKGGKSPQKMCEITRRQQKRWSESRDGVLDEGFLTNPKKGQWGRDCAKGSWPYREGRR